MKKFYRNYEREEVVFSVIFLLYKAVVPQNERTEKVVTARPSGGLRLGPPHPLPNHGEQPVGHFVDFSTALKTKIFHITWESEWNREK